MKIKEVEEQLHISSHALRYDEKMGLVQPSRDENGYRHYSKEDMELVNKIRFFKRVRNAYRRYNENNFSFIRVSRTSKGTYSIFRNINKILSVY